MVRLRSLTLVSAIVLGGCTHVTFGFRPSITSQVPDSTIVRVRATNGQPSVTGRSLDWQTGRPRIVTAAGDTVAVPDVGTLEVRLNSKKSYAAVGGLLGVAVGTGFAMAKCSYPRECPPDLRPLIGGGIGVLVGSRKRTAEWVVVKRTTR